MALYLTESELEALDEGKQTEEYLKRKRDEKEKISNYKVNRAQRDYINGGYFFTDGNGHKNSNPTTDNNPRYNSARELDRLRQDFNDVMPKKKGKLELDYEKAKEKENKSYDYARNISRKVPYYKNKSENENYANFYAARDAARRHYRRTHKNESAGIFESVEII